jgi:hypothetical protein
MFTLPCRDRHTWLYRINVNHRLSRVFNLTSWYRNKSTKKPVLKYGLYPAFFKHGSVTDRAVLENFSLNSTSEQLGNICGETGSRGSQCVRGGFTRRKRGPLPWPRITKVPTRGEKTGAPLLTSSMEKIRAEIEQGNRAKLHRDFM